MVENVDIERLKEIFVTRQECNNITDEMTRKMHDESTELALIKQQLSTISWVAKTTLASVIALFVAWFWSIMVH